jgi:hypothetical protein
LWLSRSRSNEETISPQRHGDTEEHIINGTWEDDAATPKVGLGTTRLRELRLLRALTPGTRVHPIRGHAPIFPWFSLCLRASVVNYFFTDPFQNTPPEAAIFSRI